MSKSDTPKDFPRIESVSPDAETGAIVITTEDGKFLMAREMVAILAACAIEIPVEKTSSEANSGEE